MGKTASSPLLDHCPPSLPAVWYYEPLHHERETEGDLGAAMDLCRAQQRSSVAYRPKTRALGQTT